MKVIGLMPVKNESDLLPLSLKVLSSYCDHIIIADQMSDDGSCDIYKNFEKLKIIDNKREGHSNEVRWDLLNAARNFEGNNLLLALDADELISPTIFQKFITNQELEIGRSFRFPWIQIWKKANQYNNSGVWWRSYQRAAWIDDRKTDYEKKFVINDHTSRVPEGFLKNCKRIDEVPIIHLQWLSWNKTQIKQAWYKCAELLKYPSSAIEINNSYAHSLLDNRKLLQVPSAWVEGIEEFEFVENLPPGWHLKAIFELFDKNGIEIFEPLEIWHIPQLRDEFVKRKGREPVSKVRRGVKYRLQMMKRKAFKIVRY